MRDTPLLQKWAHLSWQVFLIDLRSQSLLEMSYFSNLDRHLEASVSGSTIANELEITFTLKDCLYFYIMSKESEGLWRKARPMGRRGTSPHSHSMHKED